MMFSVIIATCNRPDRLTAALEAVASALRAGASAGSEIVVVDNGDQRLAVAAVDGFRTRSGIAVSYVSSEARNKAAALNRGIARAANDWLAFTDDDCLPDTGWLIGAAKFIARFPEVRVFSGQLRAGPVDFPLPRWLPPGSGLGLPWSPAFVDFAPLPESGVLPDSDRVPFGANIFLHRSIFEQYGGYDEALWHRCGKAALGSEDAEFAMRVRRAGESIGYCREALVVHPVIPERTTVRYYLKHIFHSGVREPFFTQPGARAPIPYLIRSMTITAGRSVIARRRGDWVGAMCHLMDACRDAGEIWGWLRGGRGHAVTVSADEGGYVAR